jgi:hypothetical protein
VQRFLEVKQSILSNTNPEFLVKLKEPDSTILKQGLEDPQPNLGRLRTAAELIWDASRQSGLNPQVIIVTLNKEQSLITGHHDSTPEKLQKALDRAMGFDCPDASGCGDLFPGFYFQLFGNYDTAGNRYLGAAKSLMKSFNTEGGRGPIINGRPAKVGETLLIENTTGDPYNASPSQFVTMLNSATAALYRYTPHVFNGNYNFWKFFQEWFRYPNGTLFALAGDLSTYIVQNGTKQQVPEFVAKVRGLDMTKKIVVSPTEFDGYPTDKVLGPVDNTVVTVAGDIKKYVFIQNVKHPVSDFVLGQRGLIAQAANPLAISQGESQLFEQGPVLPPNEGTIIRGKVDPAIYLVENSRLKLFSGPVFTQRKITSKQVTLVPDEEMATYEKQGFVAPLDNTLVKAQDGGTVYLIEQGFKRPLTGELFKNRGFSFKNVLTLSKEEVAGLTIGSFATPKNITWFADAKTGQLYLFKDGSKHPISQFVAKQRKITPNFHFGSGEIAEWPDGIAYPPKDGTYLKGDDDATVYLVSKSQLRPMTYQAYKNRKLTASKITTLPQSEINAYAKGEVLTK